MRKSLTLTDCCRDTIDLLYRQAEKKGLDFSVRYESGLPAQVLGDCERVRQILFHLVGNAVKFTEGGEIEIGPYCRREEGKVSMKTLPRSFPEVSRPCWITEENS